MDREDLRTCIEGLSALVRWDAARTEYFNIGGNQNFPETPEVKALRAHLGNFGAYPSPPPASGVEP